MEQEAVSEENKKQVYQHKWVGIVLQLRKNCKHMIKKQVIEENEH